MLLPIIFCLVVSVWAEPPSVSKNFIVLDIDSVFEITCDVSHTTGYLVTWTKTSQDGSIEHLSKEFVENLYETRNISIQYDKYSRTYSLRIEGLVASDEGVYRCELIDLRNKSRKSEVLKEIELKILSSPVMLKPKYSTENVKEGRQVVLECPVIGFPEPVVYWKRENDTKLILGASKYPQKTVVLESVSKKDAGTYFCVADNSLYKPVVRTVVLNVYGKRILPTASPYEVTAEPFFEDEEPY